MRVSILLAVVLSGVPAILPAAAAQDPAGRIAGATQGTRTPAVVVLPFDNFSGATAVPRDLAALFAKAVARRGWRVISSDDVEPLLENDRVRYLDSLDDKSRGDIVAATGASAIVSGTLYTYAEGRNPIVALSARMVRADGTFAWGDVAGLSADDTEAVLGFGRSDKVAAVAERAVDTLMRRFPSASDESGLVRGPRKPLFRNGPISFRAADLDPSMPHRVCVLPFDDANFSDSVRLVADVLSLRLAAANGYEVIEPAVLRAAALKANIGSFRWITSDDLAKLAPIVGTPLFLRGTIYEFDDPAAARSATTPQLQLEMTLVDVQSRRVLWSAQHARKGTDYVGFLMLGAVSNVLTLTDRVVSEMVATGTRPQSRSAAAAATARTAKKTPDKHSRLRGPEKDGENR
jgi:TolB-like protein